jgi:hypothetical protein
MRLQQTARAILMIVPPSVHFASILGGAASRQELRVNAPMRLERLERRLGAGRWRLNAMTDGEVAALSWTCETMALAQVARDFHDRVLWLDFEAFLQDPPGNLKACLDHLHGESPAAVVADMTASPEMKRYSKTRGHAYDAALRRSVLAEASRQYAREIRQGLVWLNEAAVNYADVAEAIKLAGVADEQTRPAIA